jgi:hypothetical protein
MSRSAGKVRTYLDDLGYAVSDIREAAGEDPDVVTVAVHLDSGPVELVLDRRLAGDLQGRDRVGGRGGEHRQDRCAHGEADVRERLGAAGEGGTGGLAEVAGEHGGAPDQRRRDVGCLGDRVEKDAFERAGPHLADEDAGHERLLVRRGALAEGPKRVAADRRRAGAGRGEQLVEQPVQVGDRETRRRGRFAHERPDGAVADTDAAPVARGRPGSPPLGRSRPAAADAGGRRGASTLASREDVAATVPAVATTSLSNMSGILAPASGRPPPAAERPLWSFRALETDKSWPLGGVKGTWRTQTDETRLTAYLRGTIARMRVTGLRLYPCQVAWRGSGGIRGGRAVGSGG